MLGRNRFTAVELIAALVAATRPLARSSQPHAGLRCNTRNLQCAHGAAHQWRAPDYSQRGFTLVELMITVAIVAILATLAAPSMTALINGNRLRAGANETIAVFQSARFEAIRANRLTVACMSANPNAAVPACGAAGASGWIVFQDSDRNGQYGAAERLIRRATVASGVKLLGSPAFKTGVTFNADGMARDVGGNLLTAVVGVCLPTTKPQENESDVSISSGSRIRVTRKNAAGVCLAPGDNP